MVRERFTSRQAAELSGVPFFTVDSWDRTRFLQPSLVKSGGRGRGRERRYSYEDVLLLRIARELRDQKVSLQTLRHIVSMLGRSSRRLRAARFVLVGRRVRVADGFDALVELLRGGQESFAFLFDLGRISEEVAALARRQELSERW